MLCESCQHTNPDENRFCGKCGALLSANSDGPSQAQNTVDYLQRVAREHPRGERPENPATPEGRYETPATSVTEASKEGLSEKVLAQERERWQNVYQFRDLHPNVRNLRSNGYPREGYDNGEQPVMQMQPELIDFDNQIPLIAEPGMDRRRPEWRFREKPLLEPDSESEVRDRVRQNAEHISSGPVEVPPPVETTAEPLVPRAKPVRHSGSIFGVDDLTEAPIPISTSASVASREAKGASPGRDAHLGNKFLDFSESSEEDRNSLHGPSFLGLDSSPMDYEEENDGGSHARRNLALVILLILVTLGAVQWRSIRDFGRHYAGTMHLSILGAQQGQTTSSTENPQEPQATQPATDGKPEMVAEATKNPNANPQNAIPQAGQQNAQSGNPEDWNKKEAANQANGSPANSAASNPTQPPSQGTSVAGNRGVPQGEPATADDAADNESAATPGRRNQPKETSHPDPGQAELAQASAASDPETAAAWLWRAVGKGSSEAQVRLADMYADGRGVPQNCEQSVILLKSAANKSFARARIRLGSMYATGKCVNQDRVAAYQWMSRALDSSPGSQWVEENRQMLWTQMSEEEKRRASGKM